jgi:DNA primase
MLVTKEGIQRVKEANELSAVAAERGVQLKRKGRHLFALCPFHEERTPSFVVTPHRGLFHCFGCGIGGDVIGFVVRYDRVSFPEALRRLAARAGIVLEDAGELPRRPDRDHQALRRWATAHGEDLCGRTS